MGKMKQSFRQMGVSIMGGYFTTFGSGVILLFTQFTFFYKFGETVSLAVTFAFLIATLVYGALMKAIGPEGEFGDVFCCLKKKEELETEERNERRMRVSR